MSDELSNYRMVVFEDIKHMNDYGSEFWLARELQKALEYTEWRNFVKILQRAMMACNKAGMDVDDHFVEVNKLIEVGKGAQKTITDYILSRYACYLIVQNGDPSKEVIALGQTYFAIKTHEQEVEEEYEKLSEDEKRMIIRESLSRRNVELFDTAKDSGIKSYPQFNDAGYMGLYGGETARDIRKRKGLPDGENILDWMNDDELSANLFRISRTNAKMRLDKTRGQDQANQAHYDIGSKIRQIIQETGDTLPEDEPTPEKSIKQLRAEAKKRGTFPPPPNPLDE